MGRERTSFRCPALISAVIWPATYSSSGGCSSRRRQGIEAARAAATELAAAVWLRRGAGSLTETTVRYSCGGTLQLFLGTLQYSTVNCYGPRRCIIPSLGVAETTSAFCRPLTTRRRLFLEIRTSIRILNISSAGNAFVLAAAFPFGPQTVNNNVEVAVVWYACKIKRSVLDRIHMLWGRSRHIILLRSAF